METNDIFNYITKSNFKQWWSILSPQIIEHKNEDKYTNRNPGISLWRASECGGVME